VFFLKHGVQVLSAAKKVNQEDMDQDVRSMPGAAAPGKYPVKYHCLSVCPVLALTFQSALTYRNFIFGLQASEYQV